MGMPIDDGVPGYTDPGILKLRSISVNGSRPALAGSGALHFSHKNGRK